MKNIVFFIQEIDDEIRIVDDMNRNYGKFDNIDEALRKIDELYEINEKL